MSEPVGTEVVEETRDDRVEYGEEYGDDEDQLGDESDEYEVDEEQVRRLSGGYDLGLTLPPGGV